MEGEEVPNTPPPIRECFFASEEGLLREHYELGWLEIEAEDLTTFCHAIPILEVEGKVLIAVPEPAWHRTVARRFLPRMALTKAILVEVAAEETEALDSLDAPGTLRVWVGLLNPVMEPTFNAGDCDEPGVQGFVDGAGVPRLPAAEGLYAVAIEHFAFVTATSGQAAPGRAATMKGKPKGGDLEKRMLHLETTLEDIKGMLSQPSTKGYQERTQPATAAPLPPAPRALGLDPGVATEAGVPEEHSRKLGAILQRPNRMTEGARATVPRNRNVLSESEEEGEAVEDVGGAAEPKEPIEQAVVQLTKLVSLAAPPGLDIPSYGAAHGRGLQHLQVPARSLPDLHHQPSLGRTPFQNRPLSQHDTCCMADFRNTRFVEAAGCGTGEGEMLPSVGGDRPVGGRRRQLDVGPGVSTRVAPSLRVVRAEEADRSVGTTGNSVSRRSLPRGNDVEIEGSRQLPREQEEAECIEQSQIPTRRRRRSSKRGEDSKGCAKGEAEAGPP